MLLGMWTTAATFYGLMFVDFPSLQQLGRLIGHSMVVCGVLTLVMVPALLPRRRAEARPARARHAAPRRVDRSGAGPRSSSAPSLVTVVLGVAAVRLRVNPTLDRLRSTTDAARLEERIGPDLRPARATSTSSSPRARTLEPLLETNERLARATRAEIPDLAFEAPSRLLPSDAAQAASARARRRRHLSARRSRRLARTRARSDAGFTAGAFDPFVDAAAGTARSGQPRSPTTTTSRTGWAISSDRFIVRDGDRWLLATYVFPDQWRAGARRREASSTTWIRRRR